MEAVPAEAETAPTEAKSISEAVAAAAPTDTEGSPVAAQAAPVEVEAIPGKARAVHEAPVSATVLWTAAFFLWEERNICKFLEQDFVGSIFKLKGIFSKLLYKPGLFHQFVK